MEAWKRCNCNGSKKPIPQDFRADMKLSDAMTCLEAIPWPQWAVRGFAETVLLVEKEVEERIKEAQETAEFNHRQYVADQEYLDALGSSEEKRY